MSQVNPTVAQMTDSLLPLNRGNTLESCNFLLAARNFLTSDILLPTPFRCPDAGIGKRKESLAIPVAVVEQ